MWAPTKTVNGNNTRLQPPPAFPSQLMPSYFQQQFPDSGTNSLNQMLRNVLMHRSDIAVPLGTDQQRLGLIFDILEYA
jgi:hypothetical protein